MGGRASRLDRAADWPWSLRGMRFCGLKTGWGKAGSYPKKRHQDGGCHCVLSHTPICLVKDPKPHCGRPGRGPGATPARPGRGKHSVLVAAERARDDPARPGLRHSSLWLLPVWCRFPALSSAQLLQTLKLARVAAIKRRCRWPTVIPAAHFPLHVSRGLGAGGGCDSATSPGAVSLCRLCQPCACEAFAGLSGRKGTERPVGWRAPPRRPGVVEVRPLLV